MNGGIFYVLEIVNECFSNIGLARMHDRSSRCIVTSRSYAMHRIKGIARS